MSPMFAIASTNQNGEEWRRRFDYGSLLHPQPFNSTLLVHRLPVDGVRGSPAHFHFAAFAVLDALHADRLRDGVVDAGAAGFGRAEAAAGLGFEFEGVALF
jgi:hypothetical protein